MSCLDFLPGLQLCILFQSIYAKTILQSISIKLLLKLMLHWISICLGRGQKWGGCWVASEWGTNKRLGALTLTWGRCFCPLWHHNRLASRSTACFRKFRWDFQTLSRSQIEVCQICFSWPNFFVQKPSIKMVVFSWLCLLCIQKTICIFSRNPFLVVVLVVVEGVKSNPASQLLYSASHKLPFTVCHCRLGFHGSTLVVAVRTLTSLTFICLTVQAIGEYQ